MATLEEENAMRQDLKNVLTELAKIGPEDLARSKDLGPQLNFEGGVVYFSRILRLFHTLNDTDFSDVPYQQLVSLRDAARNARDIFQRISEYSLQKYSSNPIVTRDQFIVQARDSYDDIFARVAPTIAFTLRKGTDFVKLEEQAKATLKRIDETGSEHATALKTARNQAEQMVEEVRKMAAESGVSQHAIHFKQEADRHDTSAGTWLKATVSLALLTVLIGVGLLIIYFRVVTSLNSGQSLQLAISKIVIFSVLITATLWAGRTYRGQRHNAVVNRHRQNALTTFQTFAKAAGDNETKNAVLLQATQCIFAPQQTGYISGEAEAAGIPQVLEIVRNLGKTP